MFVFGNRSKERMKGVHSLLIECAIRALSKSRIDMSVPWMGGVRTDQEQNAIYRQGNSQCDGFNKKSYHQTGKALDVVPYVNRKIDYKHITGFNEFARRMFEVWNEMTLEGKTKGWRLEWGGFWGNGWDKPHWQIVKN
ncbi:M15 family metallopeptidase [Flammeovirga sp. SJP92]|uniref:M15 family metallopeptidase n=1 Tax=Flammeovirga sp. SJP92 TaxID=1775430 RepID=UPI00078978C1|nr:M15 family metallopeptidase [Flammeovirga sp. SJP92]KXX70771.1 hypothetical protein AVL50_07125 [Flammeovirga sp. SJP92]